MNILFPSIAVLRISSAALLILLFIGCGNSVRTLSFDPAGCEKIAAESEDRIVKIIFDDAPSEFGSQVAIRSDSTEWLTPAIELRTFNELSLFHPADTWKFVRGTIRHAAATKSITSIVVPADAIVTGMVVGGAMGGALGAAIVSSGDHSSDSYRNLSGFAIASAAFLILDGILIGGQIGQAHQTLYVRADNAFVQER